MSKYSTCPRDTCRQHERRYDARDASIVASDCTCRSFLRNAHLAAACCVAYIQHAGLLVSRPTPAKQLCAATEDDGSRRRALVSRCAAAKPQSSDISGGLGISGLMDGPAALAAALLTASGPVNGSQSSLASSNGNLQQPCLPELLDALSLTVPALAGAPSSRRRPHSK